MKKILFAAFVAVFLVSVAFAQDEKKINYRASNAFTDDFNEATDVKWTSERNFEKASFNLGGKQLTAFYTFSGEKIGTTQEVNYETLPSKVKARIAKKYGDYTIKEIIQFDCDHEICYYVQVENDLHFIILKVSNNQVSVFRKKSKH